MELSEILSLNPLIQAWTAESPRSAATLPHTLFPLCALRVFCGEKESYGPVDSCSSYPVSCGDTPPVRFGGRAQGCRKAALAFLRVCPNPYQRLRRRPQPILPRRAGHPVPLVGHREAGKASAAPAPNRPHTLLYRPGNQSSRGPNAGPAPAGLPSRPADHTGHHPALRTPPPEDKTAAAGAPAGERPAHG